MGETGEMQSVHRSRMGEMPVWKLLLVVGIPMVISLAVQSLYNIVDTFFVSRISPDIGDASAALTALGYAFPVQMIMIAIGIGTGVGANAAISRALGEGNGERASRIAGNALFLGIIIYALFVIFGATPLVNLYVKLYGNTDQNVVDYAVTYLRICSCVSLFLVFANILEKLLQSTGRSSLTMISQVTGAVLNIALDPLFISVFGMGIAGAAVATVLSQGVSAVLNLVFHLKLNREIETGIKYMRPDGGIIKDIYSIGFAAIIAQALTALMTIFMGVFLTRLDNAFFWDEASGTYAASYASAYSTYYKVQQFGLFLAFGMRDAVTPIASYNYGTGSRKRVKQTMIWGLIYTSVLMAVCTVAVEVIPEPIMGLFADGFSEGVDVFGNSVTTLGICVDAARIISLSFVFAGVCIILQGLFQALHGGVASLVVSLCRQLVLVIPLVWIFSEIMISTDSRDLEWLNWFTFIIAEAVTAVIAVIFMIRIYKKRVSPLGDGKAGERPGEAHPLPES